MSGEVSQMNQSAPRVLVTGVTGYVGGRLAPRLIAAGYRVRALVRDQRRLEGRSWIDQVEVAQGDVFDPGSLAAALDGVDVAYYLIHSLLGGSEFHERDLVAARTFGRAARDAGVKRIIYLGGLGEPTAELSQHLRSRQDTGAALREAGVPVTEFRAAVIVGAGSVSFEMVRYLTERVPVMICPRWVFTRIQPIAIRDVLDYLVAALAVPASAGRIIEIGGANVLTYGAMMLGYARERGLRRWLVPVPVLSPRLSSYWAHWVTPIPAEVARPLIDGLRNEVVVRSPTARELFPAIHPIGYQEAVRNALAQLDAGEVETRWTDALASSQGGSAPVELSTREGMIVERRQRSVAAPLDVVYREFTSLGGTRGWLYGNPFWRLRGVMDRLVGGVGLRRGRRHPYDVRVGDAVDFWRVERVEPDHLLRLRAEMKLPGSAWLQFEATPNARGATTLVQIAYFAPKGLSGLAYWYLLYPIHRLIFSGLIRKLAEQAEAASIRRGTRTERPASGFTTPASPVG